ncbi:MAG: hypothetical protein U1F76_30030 [Candidatus Competibacteraceae bacterium]
MPETLRTLRLFQPTILIISWVVTILPLITGFMAYSHTGGRYATLLALPLLSVELLLA